MSRQVDYARANATMLRQLQTLEKASIDAKISELQGFLALRPHDRALARSLREMQELRAQDTTIDSMLAHAERHLLMQEDQGSQAAVDALLEMARLAEQQYQRELAQLHQPDEAATHPGEECVICQHSKRAVIFLPCGHLVACRQCWNEWKRRKAPACYFCREAVTHVVIATQDQRDAAAASPDGQARHAGSVNGAVPPGVLYMNAHMPAQTRPLAAMHLCLNQL